MTTKDKIVNVKGKISGLKNEKTPVVKNSSLSSGISDSSDRTGGLSKNEIIEYPRYHYTKHSDFIFSCLGSIIGYGNIRAFSSSSFTHGGGSYVVATFIFAVAVGIPMCSLEMFIGQLSGLSIGKTLGLIAPVFQGVGWAMVFMTFLKCLTLTVTIAYHVFYFFIALQGSWWSECGQEWNSGSCLPLRLWYVCRNETESSRDECTEFKNSNETNPTASTEEFYYRYLLGDDPTSNDYGSVSWPLMGALFFLWLTMACCLAFGIRISSKVSYVTVVVPYIGLFTMLITCLTQEGSVDGLNLYFSSNYSELFSSGIWVEGLRGVFWSLNVGTGTFTTLTSYNPFHNNCMRDSMVVVFIDLSTSFLSGLTIFSGAGVIAKDLKNQDNVVHYIRQHGRNLNFIIYPEIFSRTGNVKFWSSVFFCTMIILGLDTSMWLAETVITEIADLYLHCRSGYCRVILVVVFCSLSWAISAIFCLNGYGNMNVLIVDNSFSDWIVYLGFIEVLIVVGVYGYNRFATDIKLIIGKKPNIYWQILFLGTTPICLFILLIVSVFYPNEPVKYRDKPLNHSQQIYAVLLATCYPIIIISFAIYTVVRNWKKKQTFDSLIIPSPMWSPRMQANVALQQKEISDAEHGVMGEFESSVNL